MGEVAAEPMGAPRSFPDGPTPADGVALSRPGGGHHGTPFRAGAIRRLDAFGLLPRGSTHRPGSRHRRRDP